jgi:hypothetical protein
VAWTIKKNLKYVENKNFKNLKKNFMMRDLSEDIFSSTKNLIV